VRVWESWLCKDWIAESSDACDVDVDVDVAAVVTVVPVVVPLPFDTATERVLHPPLFAQTTSESEPTPAP